MRDIGLYFILSRLTGNPLLSIGIIILLYAVADRAYLGFLPDFTKPFKRNSSIRNLKGQLQVNPSNAEAAQELGVLYFEKKQYESALEYLEKAHKKIQNSARLYCYLGMTKIEMKKASEGKEYLYKALAIDQSVGFGLAYIYMLGAGMSGSNMDIDEKRRLEQGLERYGNAENFYRMGLLYKKHGYGEKAKEMFTRAIDDYQYCPRALRKIHRRWVLGSRIQRLLIH